MGVKRARRPQASPSRCSAPSVPLPAVRHLPRLALEKPKAQLRPNAVPKPREGLLRATPGLGSDTRARVCRAARPDTAREGVSPGTGTQGSGATSTSPYRHHQHLHRGELHTRGVWGRGRAVPTQLLALHSQLSTKRGCASVGPGWAREEQGSRPPSGAQQSPGTSPWWPPHPSSWGCQQSFGLKMRAVGIPNRSGSARCSQTRPTPRAPSQSLFSTAPAGLWARCPPSPSLPSPPSGREQPGTERSSQPWENPAVCLS